MENTSPAAKWESWLTRLVRYPGDDEEVLLSKKIWFSIVLFTMFLAGTLLSVCASLGMWPLVFITALFLLFLAGNLVWFLRVKRHIQQFFLSVETFKIVYSFAAVVVTGGIFQSGGLVFVGLAGIFFALIYPQPEKIWFLLALYLGSLVLEVVLQPWLVPLATFPPVLNLNFFGLTLIISVLTLFFFVRIFMRERIRFRQTETEKLRALDAAKSHFFANISHEFRTPLTVILGMADEIDKEPGRLIRRNGRKLLRLVNQLLDLSRLEAGALTAELSQVEMVAEIKYLLDSYHSLSESKGVRLHFSSESEELWADTDAYLAKPFNRRELEVELARLIRLRETLREKYRQPFSPPPNGKPPGLDERFFQDLRHCLERHYSEEEFGIQQLCAQLGMSRTQLHRKLVALTGVSASRYIRSFRLEKSKELLQTTRMTVSEVAYAAGFSDPLYFSRVFSGQYGVAPSEARG